MCAPPAPASQAADEWKEIDSEDIEEVGSLEIRDIPDGIHVAKAFRMEDGSWEWFIGAINRSARPAVKHFWLVFEEDNSEYKNVKYPKKYGTDWHFVIGIKPTPQRAV